LQAGEPSGVTWISASDPSAVLPRSIVTSVAARCSIGISVSPSRIVQSIVELGSAT